MVCCLLLQLSDLRGQQVREMEARLVQTEAAIATVLPDVDMAGLMPAPVAAAPVGSGHSRVLTAEQIARARSSPHVQMVRSILREPRERSQSGATSSIA